MSSERRRRLLPWWAWALVALAWFAAVGAAGGVYLSDRHDDRARAEAAARRWRVLAAAVASTAPPPGVRSVRPAQINPARLMRDVEALAFPRYEAADRARARAWIVERLRALGLDPRLHRFDGGVNIVAERPGSDPNAGTLLVGAHYDTVRGSPGADDNASGVAVALELARRFAERPTPRGLRLVFFDREERGLQGSEAYAAIPAHRAGLVGVVSLEMLGYACHVPGCQRYPPGLPIPPPRDRGDFLAVIADAAHPELLVPFAAAPTAARRPVVALPVPDEGRALPDARRSDHAPFWSYGLGGVMVTDTADLRYPHYHTVFDVPAALDPRFLADSAAIVVEAVGALLDPRPR